MSSGERAFKLSYLPTVLQKLKTVLRQAKAAGKLKLFEAAAIEIEHRLRTDPHGFGELKSVLKNTGTELKVGFVRPLMVEFGIHDESGVVMVKRLMVVSSLDVTGENGPG